MTIGIPVGDISQATEWYRKLLGPRREIEPVPGIREFELTPGTWLQLLTEPGPTSSAAVIRMGVDDIEREHARIRGLGIEAGPIQDVPSVIRYFNFRDPFENRWSCYQEYP